MRHTIITTVSNSPSGVPGNFDGVAMLICQGVATVAGTIPGGVVLDTAYLCSQLSDVTDVLGITEDYDRMNGLAVYQ